MNNQEIYGMVANNIKKYRKSIKITQKELAELSGYSYEYIRRIESKKYQKGFSIEFVYFISLALKIPFFWFFIDELQLNNKCTND